MFVYVCLFICVVVLFLGNSLKVPVEVVLNPLVALTVRPVPNAGVGLGSMVLIVAL